MKGYAIAFCQKNGNRQKFEKSTYVPPKAKKSIFELVTCLEFFKECFIGGEIPILEEENDFIAEFSINIRTSLLIICKRSLTLSVTEITSDLVDENLVNIIFDFAQLQNVPFIQKPFYNIQDKILTMNQKKLRGWQ